MGVQRRIAQVPVDSAGRYAVELRAVQRGARGRPDAGHGHAPPPDVDAELLAQELRIGCTLAMLLCLDPAHRMAYILGEIMGLDHRTVRGGPRHLACGLPQARAACPRRHRRAHVGALRAVRSCEPVPLSQARTGGDRAGACGPARPGAGGPDRAGTALPAGPRPDPVGSTRPSAPAPSIAPTRRRTRKPTWPASSAACSPNDGRPARGPHPHPNPHEGGSPMSETQQIASVRGTTMAYLQEGAGRPIVLLHGNPTSSYLWRNVIPHLRGHGRVHRARLVGHGRFGQAAGHGRRPLLAGRAPGATSTRCSTTSTSARTSCSSAMTGAGRWSLTGRSRHPDAVAGIAYLETIVMPFTWDGFGEIAELFRRLAVTGRRGPRAAGKPVRRGTSSPTRSCALSMTTSGPSICGPGPPRRGRRPTLTWPRQIPIDGEPPDVHATIEAIAQFLSGDHDPETVHQRRARTGDDRPRAQLRPDLPQPD